MLNEDASRLTDSNAVNSPNIHAGDFSGRISLAFCYCYRKKTACAHEEISTYMVSFAVRSA